MAYTKTVNKNSENSHQTSPAYVLTFTRWKNRDTYNYTKEGNLTTRQPLVVVNDATEVKVQCSKNTPSPQFSCVLKAGDLNYMTALSPGDFVIVNMVNWESDAMEIRQRALNSQPINKIGDGFKGVFKIIDVRMNLTQSPEGPKQYLFTITARGFDELNTLLYFNPAMERTAAKANPLFFLGAFGDYWNDMVQKKGTNNVQLLLRAVIKTCIGTGTKKIVKSDTPQDTISRYLLPPQLGQLLNRGKRGTFSASDINNYYLGIWSSKGAKGKGATTAKGFNSFFKPLGDGNFFKTPVELSGSRKAVMQDFQNVQVWSLLKNYSNSVLNEVYATYRVAEDGYVYPSIIIRQKPFNNRHFNVNNKKYKKISPHTQFLDLPRWKISPHLLTSVSIGRSDSARINFVQIFTRSLSIAPKLDQAIQIKNGNFVADEKDVLRNGMKPYIATCNFDFPGPIEQNHGQKWADLVSDWVLNGHLKLNGNIQTVGIVDPICIGDNLEFNNTVFHIESVSHIMVISPEGGKSFRTNLSLSMGISDDSNKTIPVYGEMDHTDSFTNRQEDYKNEKVLPGFSDTQDIPSRVKGEEVSETKQATFTNPIGKKPKKKSNTNNNKSIADIRKDDDN